MLGQDPMAEEVVARREFVEHMLKHTVRVVRLESDRPAGTGSGIYYMRDGRLFLLSVLHVFEGDGWFVETDLVVNDRAFMLQLPPVNWVVRGALDASGQPVAAGSDGMAWVEFDLKTLGEKITADKALDGKRPEVNAYAGPLDALPKPGKPYSFAAAPGRTDFHPALNAWPVEPLYELDMEFEGDDLRGFNRFRLAGKHRGHEFFRGCSGAPIADPEGTVVALVQGGNEREGVIYGVPLRLYGRALSVPTRPPNNRAQAAAHESARE